MQFQLGIALNAGLLGESTLSALLLLTGSQWLPLRWYFPQINQHGRWQGLTGSRTKLLEEEFFGGHCNCGQSQSTGLNMSVKITRIFKALVSFKGFVVFRLDKDCLSLPKGSTGGFFLHGGYILFDNVCLEY